MKFSPTTNLNPEQVKSGLAYVTKDGLFTEAMVAFTGGTFLVAMAMQMGATNFQIGLLAALPTLCNLFQLLSIWLVQKFRNRRLISTICSFLARFPLFIIAVLPFIFSKGTSVNVLIFLLFFHYAFGSISGASWNSWMKDLVPENQMGSYFSYRSRIAQITNVVLSISIAFALDYIKLHFPHLEMMAYPVMFFAGAALGIMGVYMMSKTPEPKGDFKSGNVFGMIQKPLKDTNFRKLMVFNSAWLFALNLATPFFTVFMLKSLNISISTIIMLSIISNISSILFVRTWGKFSDKFSNKTVIRILAPLYITTLIAWAFVDKSAFTIPLLLGIHIITGISSGGINLALTNIGLKLAAKEDAIVYIAARNMANAFIPALAPLIGGLFADYISWNYFFLISSVVAVLSLLYLKKINEEGELKRSILLNEIRFRILTQFKQWKLLPLRTRN
jgi:MFS family permease